ncbi:MAG: hypothetical protein JWS12_376 [Candidatus Saccharibacteria bacterium]|nr:hypothetical protein [Candidatus Saccharibacteria bacterium]
MGKYVFLYYAGKSDGGSNEAWGAWFEKLGDKLIDPGNPFNDGGQAVSAEGVMDVREQPVTGYSIVKADSMKTALEIAQGCPLVTGKDGAVCVYEALPM